MMGRSVHLKEKNGESNMFSVNNCDVESAARTRPISFEDIMLRRRNKELLKNVEEPSKESWNISPRGSTEKITGHIESMSYKHDRSPSHGQKKHVYEEIVNVTYRKSIKSTIVKEADLTGGKDSKKYISEVKSSVGSQNIGKITKQKTGKEMPGLRKNEYEAGIKDQRDSINKDRHAEIIKSRSARKTKKKDHVVDFENIDEYHTERKHEKNRNDKGKSRKHLIDDSNKLAEKKHHRDLDDKGRHAEGKEKHDRETNRKYQYLDDKSLERNAMVKQDLGKHHNQRIHERQQRWESVSRHEESMTKRRRSRSREHDNGRRRRSPSFSPRPDKRTYHDEERKELPMLSLKDSSRKKHSDVARDRASTNGSSSHHHRHGASTSGLGGYSPRKRKSEAAAKTPSPSKHSAEKKRAGWDLAPAGADNPPQSFVSSSFQLSNHAMLSNIQSIALATSVDPTVVKPLAISFLNDVSTGKNVHIDPVQLTQATRPMRRLYLENVPASVTEKDLMDSFNNLLLSSDVNQIQQSQRCISCILHKEKGQAVVEFLTAEDASNALSFDGSTLFGCTMKIRRPKDYVEVTDLAGQCFGVIVLGCPDSAIYDLMLCLLYRVQHTGEPERSDDTAFATSDAVIDSPNKIFVGGIANHVSSEMLMEIAGAFGSLKAYHFQTGDNNGSSAFLEYVDHSVTVKACAGLNGMKLGGEVLTVVQAMPNSSGLENGGKLLSYAIPEHSKPLLRKATQVLKIKNVFTMESISSLPDMAVEEILEDVRLECARFGTIKSLNVVKHNDKNLEPKSESEVKNKVDFEAASLDGVCDTKDKEPGFSERATFIELKGSSGMDSCYEKELENKVDADCGGCLNDEAFDDQSCLEEQPGSDATAPDTGNKGILSSNTQECAEYEDTPEESHDNMVANNTDSEAESKTVPSILVPNDSLCMFRESSLKHDASSELGAPKKSVDEEDDIHAGVFEQGSVLVEFGRTEACCSAAHCLHGRLFDGRTVTVGYVSLDQYRERFNK